MTRTARTTFSDVFCDNYTGACMNAGIRKLLSGVGGSGLKDAACLRPFKAARL